METDHSNYHKLPPEERKKMDQAAMQQLWEGMRDKYHLDETDRVAWMYGFKAGHDSTALMMRSLLKDNGNSPEIVMMKLTLQMVEIVRLVEECELKGRH